MSYNESLLSNSNYPPMSQYEWDRAPWNEPKYEPEKMPVSVQYDLCKETDIYTEDYMMEDGKVDFTWTNCEQAFKDSDEYGIPELLELFAEELEEKIQELSKETPVPTSKINHLKRIKNSCEGWEVYDHNVCLND